MSIRRYSNLAPPLPLSVGINESAPTLTVSSTFGYPEPPFILAIERGTPDEEACLCTAKTGTTFTVERGWDDTIATDHDPGDFVEHVHSAIEFRESKIVRLTVPERDALFPEEVWEGRLIWNETIGRYEFWDSHSGPAEHWADVLPSGVVVPFAGASVANGWLFCHGQLIDRTEYSRLFAVIGTTYGVGDGSTTFAIPDLRKRFPLGRGTAAPYNLLNSPGGAMDHAHTNSDAESAGAHQHTQDATNLGGAHVHGLDNTGASGTLVTEGARKNSAAGGHTFDGIADDPSQANMHDHLINSHNHTLGNTLAASPVNHSHTNVKVNSAGAHGHNILNTGQANPPYIVLNYIIKA